MLSHTLKNGSQLAAMALLTVACHPGHTPITPSQVNERVPGTNANSWKNATTVQRYLSEGKAVRINARTNMAAYYVNGTAISKWKVATGKQNDPTPKGIFRVHLKENCPAWNNGRGSSAASCAKDNPLGKKALWFHSGRLYGMHGVPNTSLPSVTANNPQERNASLGCVRNHPSNIDFIFAQAEVGMPVVVGTWDNDPTVKDCSGNGAMCAAVGTVSPSRPTQPDIPTTFPAWCTINVTPGSGYANVRAHPNLNATVIEELNSTHGVKVEGKVNGDNYAGSQVWYEVSFTIHERQTGYLHSSLVNCSK